MSEMPEEKWRDKTLLGIEKQNPPKEAVQSNFH